MDYQKERTSYVERAQDYIRETSKGVRLTNLALILASSITIGACGTTNRFMEYFQGSTSKPTESSQTYNVKAKALEGITAKPVENVQEDTPNSLLEYAKYYIIKFWKAGAKDDCSGLGDGTNLDGKKIWYCTGPDGGDGGPGGGDGGAGGAGGDGGGSGSGGAGAGT